MEEEKDGDEFLNGKHGFVYGKKDEQQVDIAKQPSGNEISASDVEKFIDNLSGMSVGTNDKVQNKIVKPASFESVGETKKQLNDIAEKRHNEHITPQNVPVVEENVKEFSPVSNNIIENEIEIFEPFSEELKSVEHASGKPRVFQQASKKDLEKKLVSPNRFHLIKHQKSKDGLNNAKAVGMPSKGTFLSKNKIIGIVVILVISSIIAVSVLVVFYLNAENASSLTADFSYDISGLTISFTDKSISSGGITSWLWSFGDGTSSTSSSPQHIYSSDGKYWVNLIVEDNTGKNSSFDKTVILTSEDSTSEDSDGDGYPDVGDYVPDKDAKVRFSIIKFELNNTVDYTNGTLVYFQVYERLNYSWEDQTQDSFGVVEKSPNFYVEDFNDLSNFNMTYDVADDVKLHTLTIQVYEYNLTGIIDEILDLDDDGTGSLSVDYDIVSETWTGDDDTGVTDGSRDGIAGQKDCYLEYSLTTV